MAGSSAAIHCVNSPAPAAPSEKKKRNQPGTPSPDAEVVALSPKTLLATNRFICEVCNKGFQREQNLQLHRRGHNLPWKLKQKEASRGDVARKKVYLCPEPGCVHHDPARALGDLTGIKKHFSRKHMHGEKRFTCDKCNKKYAVQSDCKAHSKQCGSKAYKCDCGTTFSRQDSFVSHQAYCEALAQETADRSYMPTSVSSIAAPIYANASSPAMSTMGSTAPLVSVDHQKQSSPVSELDELIDASRTSFTDLLSGRSVGSACRPIQPLEPKLSFQEFSEFQSLRNNNTAPAGPVFNLDSPYWNYEAPDLKKMNNNAGLFTGLMMNDAADAPVYRTPQLSATALLQKAAHMGSNSSSTDLLKSLGCSSSAGNKFDNYGGVFGDGMSGVGASGGAYHGMYNSIDAGVTTGSYGVMYNNAKNSVGMEWGNQQNDNLGLEPQWSVQSGYCDKLTRDFLGIGKRVRNFDGEMDVNQKRINGHGMKLNSSDSQATTSAEPNLPVNVGSRRDI